MIGDLKPYADYRDSGLDWLGSIPAHWGLLRAKRLFREVDERSKTGKEELLSVSHLTGVTPRRLKNVTMFMAESNVGHKVCRPGDLVVNTLWAWMAALGVTRHAGIVSPAYGVYRPVEGGGMLPAFADHLLRTPLYAAEYQRRSTGVNSSRLRLYPEQFLRMPVLLPPPDEQAAIVRFLAWANGRLDRAIRAKRKVIALLTEQKQAIINRAVTRGIAEAVQLIPSGNSLLEHIPADWELSALRRRWQVLDCKHLTVPFVENGTPLASVVQVRNFTLDLSSCKRTKPEWFRQLIEGDRRPKRGDLIYCRNASVGSCAIVDTDVEFAMGQDVCLIRSRDQNQRFLNYVLHSPFMKRQLDLLLVGSTFKRINVSDIKALTIPVPPKVEQDSICNYLDTELSRFDVATGRIAREIDLLREYRTRLIAGVVAGTFDVRTVVKTLPDEEVADLLDEPVDEADDADLVDEATEA
ncbi:MAG: restriction endonuclease subunit S [Burkholderiaceae bacterium]|nr:MAG: restriction endonuclease subunit S [Burkholderiaceae bacterium]